MKYDDRNFANEKRCKLQEFDFLMGFVAIKVTGLLAYRISGNIGGH